MMIQLLAINGNHAHRLLLSFSSSYHNDIVYLSILVRLFLGIIIHYYSLSVPLLLSFVMYLYFSYYSSSNFVGVYDDDDDDDDDITICWIGHVGISCYYIYCCYRG